MVLGMLPPRKIVPGNCPRDNFLLNYCPRIIAPEENCPLITKFLSKIIAPTQVNSPQRVYERTEENYPLSRNTIIKESLYQKLLFKAAT